MRLITVLNRCTTFKRFVFEGSHFDRHGRIMVRIRPRKNSGARAAAAVTWPPPTELEQEHRRKQEAAGEQEPTPFLDQITVICSDIWKAYLNVISKRLPRGTYSRPLSHHAALQQGPRQSPCRYPAWAEKFLQRWCFRTMRSNIEPMKDIAGILRRHQELILNWFRARKQFNNGMVEGLNLKWNLTVRKAFGFRTFKALQIASFHQLGDLPEPQFTHEFY